MTAITLTPKIYRDLADKIVNNLSMNGVCDEEFYWETEDFAIEAPIKCVVRRQRDSEELNPIVDVSFIWAELHTITDDGEVINNFDIDTLKSYIIR